MSAQAVRFDVYLEGTLSVVAQQGDERRTIELDAQSQVALVAVMTLRAARADDRLSHWCKMPIGRKLTTTSVAHFAGLEDDYLRIGLSRLFKALGYVNQQGTQIEALLDESLFAVDALVAPSRIEHPLLDQWEPGAAAERLDGLRSIIAVWNETLGLVPPSESLLRRLEIVEMLHRRLPVRWLTVLHSGRESPDGQDPDDRSIFGLLDELKSPVFGILIDFAVKTVDSPEFESLPRAEMSRALLLKARVKANALLWQIRKRPDDPGPLTSSFGQGLAALDRAQPLIDRREDMATYRATRSVLIGNWAAAMIRSGSRGDKEAARIHLEDEYRSCLMSDESDGAGEMANELGNLELRLYDLVDRPEKVACLRRAEQWLARAWHHWSGCPENLVTPVANLAHMMELRQQFVPAYQLLVGADRFRATTDLQRDAHDQGEHDERKARLRKLIPNYADLDLQVTWEQAHAMADDFLKPRMDVLED